MNQTYMKDERIFPLIIKMSLPMVVSMWVNSMYNIVDSFFVAKISESAMTALSLVYPLQNLINAVMIGFGIGVNASIAYFLGAGDERQAHKSAGQGIVLSTIHGIIFMIACIIGIKPFLQLFTTDVETISYGIRYSNIAFMFSVIIAWQLIFEKTFQAVGRMMATMICMMAGFITNIILDPVLIFGIGIFPEMGIDGAALATGLGQAVSLLFYLWFYKFRPINIRFKREYFKLDKRTCLRLYSVGIPASLNIALPSVLISALNVILAGFSQSYVFVLGIYYKLQTFLYLPANGVVQGIRPIIGYNYGAKELDRVKKIFYTAMAIVAVIMVIGTVLCILLPDMLMSMFTQNSDTVLKGVNALRILCAGFVVSAVSVTATGALEGLGKGTLSLIISLLRYALLIIPIAYVLSILTGVTGVWHAFWITESITSVIAYIIFIRMLKYRL